MSDIHVRLLAIDKPLPAAWHNDALTLLDKTEETRYQAYAHRSQQLQFLAGRWLVKHLIAQSANIAPTSVTLAYKDGGKPYISAPQLDMHFSITHTDKWVACCIANNAVGIDIEALGRQPINSVKIARLLNASVANLIDEQSISHSQTLDIDALFTLYWTSFESMVKIRGTSIFAERKAFLYKAVTHLNESRLQIRTSQGEYLESVLLGECCLGLGVRNQNQDTTQIKKELIETLWSKDASHKSDGKYQIKITPLP